MHVSEPGAVLNPCCESVWCALTGAYISRVHIMCVFKDAEAVGRRLYIAVSMACNTS